MTPRRGFDWSRFAALPAIAGPACALWLLITAYQGTALLYIP